MIIISDTSPINYLVLIGEINILAKLFGRVLIPAAVLAEFHHPGTPKQVTDWADSSPAWLEVHTASPAFLAQVKKLGAGEREAIALALELQANAVLIDERKGTKEARINKLLVLGTLAILERAGEMEYLDFPTALTQLRQTNFRFPPPDVMQQMLDRDTLRKQSKGTPQT